MLDISAENDPRHVFHVVDFKQIRTFADHIAVVPVGPKETCINETTERRMTTDELFSWIIQPSVGDKTGSAIVPACFDISSGGKPRTKREVIGGPAFAILDSDKLNKQQADRIFNLLKAGDYKHFVYSTHSYKGPGEPCKFRLGVLLDRAQVSGREVSQVRVGLAKYLSEMTDLLVKEAFDSSTSDEARLFYLHRVSSLQAPRFSWQSGSKAFSVDAMIACLGDQEKHTRAESTPRPKGEWSPELVSAARFDLMNAAHLVAGSPGDALRETLKRRFTALGGYVGLNILDEDEVLDELEKALESRASRFPGQDDRTVEYRLKDAQGLIKWGAENRLCLPQGFTSDGAADEKAPIVRKYGMQRSLQQLQQAPCPNEIRLEDASQLLYTLVRSPTSPGRAFTQIIKATPGAGKTYAMIQLIEERSRQGLVSVIMAPTHALLHQTRLECEAKGIVTFHYAGVEAPTATTGRPECVRLAQKDKHVLSVLQTGSGLARSVCPTCPLAKHCEARANAEASPWDVGATAIFMSYAAAPKLFEMELPADAAILMDEQCSPKEQLIFTAESIRSLAQSSIWLKAGGAFASRMKSFIYSLLDGEDLDPEMLAALARYRGRPDWSHHVLQHSDFKKFKDLTVSLLKAAHAAHVDNSRLRTADDDTFIAEPLHPVHQILQEYNATVFTATPDMEFFEGINHEVLDVDVRDFLPTVRIFHYEPHCTRKHVIPGGQIDEAKVARDLKEDFAKIRPGMKTLLVTWKPLAEALNGHLSKLVPDNVLVTHYEAVVGRNDWKDVDCVYTLYEQIRPPKVQEDGSLSWDASINWCRALTCQAQHRSRDAQPRKTAALHIHRGNQPPLGWNRENTLMVSTVLTAGGMTSAQCDALHQFVEIVGKSAAAEKLGVSRQTLHKWITGRVSPKPENLDKLNDLLKPVVITVGTNNAETVKNGQSSVANRSGRGDFVAAAVVGEGHVSRQHAHRFDFVHCSGGSAGAQNLALTARPSSREDGSWSNRNERDRRISPSWPTAQTGTPLN